jgi:hypothetical protein
MVLLQLLSEDKKKKKLLSVDKDAQFKDVYDQALTTPPSLCSTFFTTGVMCVGYHDGYCNVATQPMVTLVVCAADRSKA